MDKENKDEWGLDLDVSPHYKKGFEHGYWLCLGDSDELESVIRGSARHEQYHSGIQAGKKEAEIEKFRERMKQLDKDKENDKDKGFEIG